MKGIISKVFTWRTSIELLIGWILMQVIYEIPIDPGAENLSWIVSHLTIVTMAVCLCAWFVTMVTFLKTALKYCKDEEL